MFGHIRVCYPVDMDISPQDFGRLVELWDCLEAFPVDAETEANLFLMRKLSDWLSADYAYWCGLVRLADGDAVQEDPLAGWRMRVSEQHKLPEVYTQNHEELLKTSILPKR